MIQELKQLRLNIDATRQLSLEVGIKEAIYNSNMHNLLHSLNMAKAYVGKLLGEIGEPTPYQNDGKRETVADVEPTDAVAKADDILEANSVDMVEFAEKTYVGKIDWLREYVQNQLIPILGHIDIGTREGAIYRTQAFVHLTDARLHLGFELGRLRDAK